MVPPARSDLEEAAMQIEERVVDEVTILDLKGKITLGEGDELLKDKINSLILQDRSSCCSTSKASPTSTARASAKSSAPTRR